MRLCSHWWFLPHIIHLHPPWKHSRYSSFCMLLATCMMAMGKLWDEAANTAEASDMSFLSKNSGTGPNRRRSNMTEMWARWLMRVKHKQQNHCCVSVSLLTLKHKLLHFNLVELVGADDDAVVGQMDAAAGLQGLNFLSGLAYWVCERCEPGRKRVPNRPYPPYGCSIC